MGNTGVSKFMSFNMVLICLVVMLLSMTLSPSAHAFLPSELGKGPSRPVDKKDLIPWPWGSECPFPWSEIEGTYKVRRIASGPYSGHLLVLNVNQSNADKEEALEIEQFTSGGSPYSFGDGYALKDKRLVKGMMTPYNGGERYSVIVRTYVKNKDTDCGDERVTVVTFCPLRGRKCLKNSNYELIQIDPTLKKK